MAVDSFKGACSTEEDWQQLAYDYRLCSAVTMAMMLLKTQKQQVKNCRPATPHEVWEGRKT